MLFNRHFKSLPLQLAAGFCLTLAPLTLLNAAEEKSATAEAQAQAQRIALVSAGKPSSVIILPHGATADPALLEICNNFVQIVKQSTGAQIAIHDEANLPALDESIVRISIGQTNALAAEAGVAKELGADAYQIYAKGNKVFIHAPVQEASPHGIPPQPIRWALNSLLTKELGVAFLWPGALGTHIPEHREFTIPEMEKTYQPKLLLRSLRMPKEVLHALAAPETADPQLVQIGQETTQWLQNHQAGRRGKIHFGHAFTKWWKKYGATHPDYFALPPAHMSEPIARPDHPPHYVKLRLSNPAVIEQIAAEYQEAGAPDYYNICPNDGGGYDLSPATLAWDDPQDQDLEAVWKDGKANLTARYVKFWNLLSERLQKINPKVTLLTYAYSSYRLPPSSKHPLTGPTIVSVVDGWDAYEIWEGWQRAGAKLYLRPNWGFLGAGAPFLPLEEIHKFLSFATEKEMIGFDLDALSGHWAAEGITFYLIARTLAEPELSKDEIIAEYTAAFGAATGKVKEYIDYWQAKATQHGYPKLAGGGNGAGTGPKERQFKHLQDTGIISTSYFKGPYEALPYLYDDATLAPAYQLLEEAEALVQQNDPTALQRVLFLKSALDNARLTRDLMHLGTKIRNKESSGDEFKQFQAKSLERDLLRSSLPDKHAIWSVVSQKEDRFKLPLRPKFVRE